MMALEESRLSNFSSEDFLPKDPEARREIQAEARREIEELYEEDTKKLSPKTLKAIQDFCYESLLTYTPPIDRARGESERSVEEILHGMFPGSDINFGSLELVVSPGGVEKVTDTTLTGVVFNFAVDRQRFFCKMSRNVDMLRKEAAYAELAWKHFFMRSITPKLVDFSESGGVAALTTQDVKCRPRPDPPSIAYALLESVLTERYAAANGLDISIYAWNPFVHAVLNLALSHSFMRPHLDNPVFGLANVESIASIEKLESRLQSASDADLASDIRSFLVLYQRVASEASAYDSSPDVIIHGDPRIENRFGLTWGKIALGDFGLVKPGVIELDLGKLECADPSAHVPLYVYFRNQIEQSLGRNFEISGDDMQGLKRRVINVAFCSAVRLAAYKAFRGLSEDCRSYVSLARTYAGLVKN